MKKTFLVKTGNVIILLFIIALLASCEQKNRNTKQFVWNEEVKKITGGNLITWLQEAPFENELKPSENDKLIITNAEQVFPFMGRYYNEIEELRRDFGADTLIYTNHKILFQDPVWGDLFLHASLQYDKQEIFLDDKYIQTGSPFFGGVDAVMDLHDSSLQETGVYTKNQKYKTGIYWAWANYHHYLLGFYQQGQLVFETAVPLLRNDTLATLNKLKEVNTRLQLNIPEWEKANVSQLKPVEHPKSFWKDPFSGIYNVEFGSDVYLKIKNSPFVQDYNARKGDYYFSYKSKGGDVSFYTLMKPTEMNREDFEKANKKLASYQYSGNTIFYEEHPKNQRIIGVAKSYFKGNQYLEINYSYPQNDLDAKKQIHDVLRYVRTLNYEYNG